MALRVHPDKNPGDLKARENFQKINEAYNILIDSDRRALYDETGFKFINLY